MPEIEIAGKKIELNEEGFLANPKEWNEVSGDTIWRRSLLQWCARYVKIQGLN